MYQYESPFHLTNVVKKLLRKRGIFIEKEYEDELLGLACDVIFQMNNNNQSIIRAENMRKPVDVLTWKASTDEINDVYNDFILKIEYLAVQYEELFSGKKSENDYPELFMKTYNLENYYNELTIDNRELTEDFKKDMLNIVKRNGIYFLYDSSKKLIYVGKSTDLGSRIPSSVSERKAYYYSYALTKTMSDIGIYEMYYISKLKPKLNIEGKYPDLPTIKLPDLEKTEIKPIFSKVNVNV